jgi:hypothetical protein
MDQDDQLRIAFIVAIGGAIVTALAGMFGFHDGSVWRAPIVLEHRVEAALTAEGLQGVEVDMHGQKAVLRGVVPTAEAIALAQHTALRAAGGGGSWAGGVTQTDVSNLIVGVIEQPFAWKAWRDGSSVVLSGAAPSEMARATLSADATALFPNAITLDDMHVAGGAPTPNWTEIAQDALGQLAQLDSGEVRIEDAQIILAGRGSDVIRASVEAHYENPPAPYQVRIDVSVED